MEKSWRITITILSPRINLSTFCWNLILERHINSLILAVLPKLIFSFWFFARYDTCFDPIWFQNSSTTERNNRPRIIKKNSRSSCYCSRFNFYKPERGCFFNRLCLQSEIILGIQRCCWSNMYPHVPSSDMLEPVRSMISATCIFIVQYASRWLRRHVSEIGVSCSGRNISSEN